MINSTFSYGIKKNKRKILITIYGGKKQTKIWLKIGDRLLFEKIKRLGYFSGKITKNGRCTMEIRFRIRSAKRVFNRHKTTFTKIMDQQK